jgi:hypothetical protein
MRAPLDALPDQEDDLDVSVERKPAHDWLAHWGLGLILGALAGIAPLALGTIGLALAVPVVLWSIADRPRLAALSGSLIGVGAAWLIVWLRLVEACPAISTATEGCEGPDLSAFIVLPVGLLVAGGLLSVLNLRPRT